MLCNLYKVFFILWTLFHNFGIFILGDDMRKDRRGFTLVELIATLVVLALVMSIGSYTIVNLINKSKDENYKILIENINSAANLYYQECRYGDNIVTCNGSYDSENDIYTLSDVSLGMLVTNGFLKGNGEGDSKLTTLVNPNDNQEISGCEIKITYSNGELQVSAVNPIGSCPGAY